MRGLPPYAVSQVILGCNLTNWVSGPGKEWGCVAVLFVVRPTVSPAPLGQARGVTGSEGQPAQLTHFCPHWCGQPRGGMGPCYDPAPTRPVREVATYGVLTGVLTTRTCSTMWDLIMSQGLLGGLGWMPAAVEFISTCGGVSVGG